MNSKQPTSSDDDLYSSLTCTIDGEKQEREDDGVELEKDASGAKQTTTTSVALTSWLVYRASSVKASSLGNDRVVVRNIILLVVLCFFSYYFGHYHRRSAADEVFSMTTMTATTATTASLGDDTKRKTVMIGTAYNNEKHLHKLKSDLIAAATEGNLDILHVVVFENDSKDNTRHILTTDWSQTWNVTVIGHDGLRAEFDGDRTKTLAYARNSLLNHLRDELTYLDFDYVINLDLDEVNYNLRNVDTCFDLPQGWGACCTNNYRTYYDLWALRTLDDWVDCDVLKDCVNCKAAGLEGDECKSAKWEYKQTRKIHISAREPPIEVESCFGGAALYDYNFIKQVPRDPYEGTQVLKRGKFTSACEHVSFNRHIGAVGGKLYIQPKMLSFGVPKNVDAWESEIHNSMDDPDFAEYYKGFPYDVRMKTIPP